MSDREAHEFRAALQDAEQRREPVEPSAAERRNGWTAETLTKYLAEQEAAAAVRLDPHSTANRRNRRPGRTNGRYRPQRWRG